MKAAISGLRYLADNRGILHLILFLVAINFTASIFEAAMPAMLLSKCGGSSNALGLVNAFSGIAMLAGSVAVSVMPAPKSRVRVICNTLLVSMSTENFLLALGSSVPVWCIGSILGWISIPVMNANMDVLFRSYIPITMQGRVYSARNTLQFLQFRLVILPVEFWWTGYLNLLWQACCQAVSGSGSLGREKVPARRCCS